VFDKEVLKQNFKKYLFELMGSRSNKQSQESVEQRKKQRHHN